jgi:hypothetical protein
MDELRMIRELLPERRPPARAAEQARARLDELIRQSRPRRPRRSRGLAVGLTAAAAAVTVAAVAIPILSGGTGPEAGRPGAAPGPGSASAAVPLSAKDVLLLAARREERSAAPSGKYWHVRTVSGNTDTVIGTGAGAYHLERRSVSETWISVDAPATLWTGHRGLGARPATRADEEAWRRAGSPSQWDLGPGDTVDGRPLIVSSGPDGGHLAEIRLDEFAREGLEPLGPAELATLPTDPIALREYLLGMHARTENAGDPDRWLFAWASNLLVELPASPSVRAAALRIIADLPGVRTQGAVRDPLGRDGTGILQVDTTAGVTYTHQLIIDPDTGQLLARVIGGTPAEKAKDGYIAVLDAGWTDGEPHVPSADIG